MAIVLGVPLPVVVMAIAANKVGLQKLPGSGTGTSADALQIPCMQGQRHIHTCAIELILISFILLRTSFRATVERTVGEKKGLRRSQAWFRRGCHNLPASEQENKAQPVVEHNPNSARAGSHHSPNLLPHLACHRFSLRLCLRSNVHNKGCD